LKHELNDCRIEEAESARTKQMMVALQAIPGVNILGNTRLPRIGIFSFNISVGEKMLHHNFVVAVLNDLFGIQARGGCSCAGPYGHSLLTIDETTAESHERVVTAGKAMYRPGWVRLSVNWFFSREDIEKMSTAISFVARHGLLLLRHYEPDLATGIWQSKRAVKFEPPSNLAELWRKTQPAIKPEAPCFEACLEQAESLVRAPISARASTTKQPGETDEENLLRWFWLESDLTVDASASSICAELRKDAR
jgi:hypothetical protein